MRSILGLALTLMTATWAQAQVIVQRGPGGGGGTRMTIGGNPVLDESPGDYGVAGWRVGMFARYSISQNMGQMPLMQSRQVSVVGQRGDQFWVEIQDEMSGMMSSRGPVRKMLIPFGPVRARVGTETYVMGPDSAVTRSTLLRAGRDGDGPGFRFPEGWTRVGEEQVTVAAGAMRAVRWRKGSENLWTSGTAGPLGVVKYESDDIMVELTGTGTDARSRIPYGGN